MSEIEKAIENLQGIKGARYATISENMGELYEKIVLDDLDSLDMAIKALDQLRWRDAEKELPKYTGDYNVVCNVGSMLGGYTTVRTYRFERIPGREPKWYIPNRPDEVVTITHWLPLPTPPEVKK